MISPPARLLGLGLLSLLAACSSPDEPAPAGFLTLRFSHVIGGAPIHVGQAATTRYGQEVTFDHLRYWVSNVVLAQGDKRVAIPASYYLVEQTKERDKLSLKMRVPPGSYDALIFHIGVDPPHNASLDLAEGELAAGIGMDWSWDTGYKFLRTQGEFEQGGLLGSFSFHTGSDVLYKELTAKLPEALKIAVDKESALDLEAEVDRIFAGVQLETEPEIAGGTVDSPAAKVAGNYSRMFRLVTGGERLPLTASSPNLDAPPQGGPIPTDSTPPVLSAPVLKLDSALVCTEVPNRPASEARACLTPFQLLPASGAAYDAGLLTFVTGNGAPVYASAPGVVSDITYIDHSMLTHSDLFTISVRPNGNSAYWMVYGNVKGLKVAEGDSVAAGQVLGGVGDYFDPSTGLLSFGVRRHQEVVQRLCPTRFTTPDLEATYKAALGASNTAWPEFAHADLCSSPSLLCTGMNCDIPADFVPVGGDVDEGRRIYKTSCASCHGDKGEGSIGSKLCAGSSCSCKTCGDQAVLAARIGKDMPPEGYCDPRCSADVAAFILHEFAAP